MESLPFEIAETAHALRRAFDRRAAKLGVTRAQWRVLARLDREPELRQVELAERLEIEPITLCRIVDRLEESGLVERRHDPADRRAWRLSLTQAAAPLIAALRELAGELASAAFAGLDMDELAALGAGLERVRANLAQSPRGKRVAGQ